MHTREAARRWAETWRRAWPERDLEAICALQAPAGDHWASLFRPYRGREGLRDYLRESFSEETAPAEVWFGEPLVDESARSAAVEYWSTITTAEGPIVVSGCTVVTFDAEGLAVRARDYSHVKEGREERPTTAFG